MHFESFEFWMLTPEYAPFYSGGIATYAGHASKLASKIYGNVRVFHPYSGKYDQIENIDGIEIHRFSLKKWTDDDLKQPHAVLTNASLNYIRHILKNTMDKKIILEICEWGGISYSILNAKFVKEQDFNFPIYISSHGPLSLLRNKNCQIEVSLENEFIESIEKSAYSLADKILAPTQTAKKELVNFVGKHIEQKIEIIPYPIEVIDQTHLSIEHEIDLLFFGRKQNLKGYDFFLKAISGQENNLNIATIGAESWLYSEGCSSIELEKKLDLNLKHFGVIEPKRVANILSKTKVVVIPSRIEWYSYAALESLAKGTYVIVPDNVGSSELGRILGTPHLITFKNQDIENLRYVIFQTLENFSENFEKDTLLSSISLINKNFERFLTNQKDNWKRENVSFQNTNDVTIVLPHFNLSKYLDQAIDSIQKSIDVKTKIIVIDDGSDKQEVLNAQNICEKRGVDIVVRPNGGLSATRNLGITLSETEFVCFLDSDDMLENTYLKKCILAITNGNYHASGSHVQVLNESGQKQNIWRTIDPQLPLNLYINCINTAGLVWRKSVLQELNGYDESMVNGFEDWDMVNRALKANYRIFSIAEPLFLYRVRHNGMFKSMKMNQKKDIYRQMLEKYSTSLDQNYINNMSEIYGIGYLLPSIWHGPLIGRLALARRLKVEIPFLFRLWSHIPYKFQSRLLKLLIK